MRRFFLSVITGIVLGARLPSALAETNLVSVKLDDETRKLLRAATEDKWFKKDTLISTLIGGILAASGGFTAVGLASWLQARQESRKDHQFNANVLAAIRRELEALGTIYDKGIGEQLREVVDGQFLNTSFAMSQNWFTVFDANAAHLGRLDAESAKQIVSVYVMLKGLVEEYKINNEYLKQRIEIGTLTPGAGNALHFRAEIGQIENRLVAQATKLKKLDYQLKSAVEEFCQLLDQRGIK